MLITVTFSVYVVTENIEDIIVYLRVFMDVENKSIMVLESNIFMSWLIANFIICKNFAGFLMIT